MKKYTLHLREIRVTPVEIEANSLKEAKELVLEGEGEGSFERAYSSDLNFDELSGNLFETGFENGKEIPWKKLNA